MVRAGLEVGASVRLVLLIPEIMSRASSDIKSAKRPGQSGTPIMLRLQPAQLAALDAWIEGQAEPRPSRPEAIRQILAGVLNV